MDQDNRLGKTKRLKSRKQIDLLFKTGRRLTQGPFRVNYVLEKAGGTEPLQAGVGAASRNFRRAVDRNRIKRLMREAWRLNRQRLEVRLAERGFTLRVFIIYSSKELPTQLIVTEQIGALILKLDELLARSN